MSRTGVEKIIQAVLFILTASGLLILALILAVVIGKGGPAIGADFIFQESQDFGAAGGIYYQIIGTLLLMMGAAWVSLPLALGAALFQTEYLRSPGWKQFFRHLVYSLNGVPTILFGLVGYLFFGVYLGTGISWVTGVLILAVMILPTLLVSIQEAIEALPEKYRESGLALGLSPWQQIRSIILPQSAFGVVTGVLLGLARAAGETAAIMFTATVFSGVKWPETWADPVPTLQTHILVLAQEAVHPEAVQNAWGAALVLLALVFCPIAMSLFIRNRLQMESER